MDAHKLQVILQKHKAWLNNEEGGERANLRFANLHSADLRSADLRYADLRYADLRFANLHSADLRFANLRFANLRFADLHFADLRSADLHFADLRSADLHFADLHFADLGSADLRSAYLRFANLRFADLGSANLRSADLSRVKNLSDLQIKRTQICPQSGSFIAFKKLSFGVIAKLEIPATAQRSNASGSRKCRASKAKVVKFFGSEENKIHSEWDKTFFYTVGEVVEPTKPFDENWPEECASGIHFYLSKEEAEAH